MSSDGCDGRSMALALPFRSSFGILELLSAELFGVERVAVAMATVEAAVGRLRVPRLSMPC